MSKVIVLHADDNVATAVSDLSPGEMIQVNARTVKVNEAIPFGHKVALKDIDSGSAVVKYGESIGLALFAIQSGAYVHIHNIESQRGRGDLKGETT
ncbi:MAG: D-galactarate dehydratase [Candidimonas sp.]|nr:MAG: D-galactarate dehydratase [Candidimonas sp.]TAM27051.1 MAG: D-galactarate dehydratase [Candidimonas sp.]